MKGIQFETNQQLLDQTRTTFNEIKQNYSDFLSSLKYESLTEKKAAKNTRRRMEEAVGDQGWDNLVEKTMSFEQEMAVENAGQIAFNKLLENIQKLEAINNQISLKHISEGRQKQNRDHIAAIYDFLGYTEEGVIRMEREHRNK